MRHAYLLVILAVPFVVPTVLYAQQQYFAGVSGWAGVLHSPYGGSCAGDEGAAASIGVYAGRSLGALEVTASFSRAKNIEAESVVCGIAPGPTMRRDGIRRARSYERGHNPGMDLVALRLAYSLPGISYAALNAGVGVETRDGNLAYLTGATVRTRGATRLRAGVEFTYLRTPYSEILQEWRDGMIISSQPGATGSAWRHAIGLWVGVEVALPPPDP